MLDRAEGEAVSLVLMEVHSVEKADLPAMMTRLKSAVRPAPIGLLTALRPSDAQSQVEGFDFVLRKPFSLSELLTAVGLHTKSQARVDEETAVKKYFDTLSRRDWPALAALCSPTVEYNLPGQDERLSGNVKGREALKVHAQAAFEGFPEAKFAVKETVALPQATIGPYSATWQPDAKLDGAVLFRFEGGLISQIGVRLEMDQMLAQASESS